MFTRLGYVFGAVMALGLVYYLFTSAASALDASRGLPIPSIVPPPGYSVEGASMMAVTGPSAGLTAVDFGTFAKGGSGWNYVTQGYGNTPYSYMYFDHWHNGIDIAAVYGAPIYSPAPDGSTVVAIGDQDDFCPRRAFGKFIVIEDSAHHVMLMFAHLDQIFVGTGQSVLRGAKIATVGATGDETGTHLHLSVFEANGFSVAPAHGCGPYPQGRDVDPTSYLIMVE